MKRLIGSVFLVLVFVFSLTNCTVISLYALEGQVHLFGESVPNAVVSVWNLLNPEVRKELLTDSEGYFRLDGLSAGEWGIQAEYIEPDYLRFTYEGTFTAQAGLFKELPLDVVPFEERSWNLTVLSFSDSLTEAELAAYFAPIHSIELTFLQKNLSGGLESYYLSENQIRPFYRPFAPDFSEGVKKALEVSLKAFPAEKTILYVIDDAHGWRLDARSDYPEDVFYDQTTSILEFDEMLEGQRMDLLLSTGSYSGLLENLFQVKDHFDTSVLFEGLSPANYPELGLLFARLKAFPSPDALAFAEDSYTFFCASLAAMEEDLIREQNGMGCSVIDMNRLEALSSSLKKVFDQLTLLLTEASLKEAVKKDLGFTLDWNTLAFDFCDYKDAHSWLTVLKNCLNGSLFTNDYKVKSREDGYVYDLQEPMLQQLLQFIDEAEDRLREAVLWNNHYGFCEDIVENGKKMGKKNMSQMSGISFWYPLSVKGGLWNVYGKEKYDRLSFSQETGWTVFLNRLMSVDQLPAKQLLQLDRTGDVITGSYQPNKPLDSSGATINFGFLDREAIDRFWMLLGEEYLTEQTLIENGGLCYEDESSIRCYLPVGVSDTGKSVGARILLRGKEEPVDFDYGFILPVMRGKNLIVADQHGNGLLQVSPGNELFISSVHSVIIESEVEEWRPGAVLIGEVSVEGPDSFSTYPLEEVYRYDGKVLFRSDLIPATAFGASPSFRTFFTLKHAETNNQTENQTGTENWIIHIVQ